MYGDDSLIGAGAPPAPVDVEKVKAGQREFEINRALGQARIDFVEVLDKLAGFDFKGARGAAVAGLTALNASTKTIDKLGVKK